MLFFEIQRFYPRGHWISLIVHPIQAMKKQLNILEKVLGGLVAVLALGVIAVLFMRFLRKLRSADRPDELLRTDPLILYMIHRRGKLDSYAYPVEFLSNTWKWSTPPGRSTSTSVTGDSGYSGGGDSGGGSDGGGAGAD
jgi:uncharacterized membrane protein YgcG